MSILVQLPRKPSRYTQLTFNPRLTYEFHIALMSKELDVNPSEVVFLETLKESKYSMVFKVRFQEKLCVMKVVSQHPH